jgi:diadenylate cyclase
MTDSSFSFLDFRFLDVIDILMVAVIIYYIYSLIRGTIALNILFGLLILYVVYLLVKQLNMHLLAEILGGFVLVGPIALIIVFQTEIRRFLLLIGKNVSIKKTVWWIFIFGKKEIGSNNSSYIKPVIDACKTMKASRTGALIIFAKYFDEQYYQNSGESMDAFISKRLLESIFQKYSPLHDGAMVITDGKIKCASCILPLTDNEDLPVHFGLRHRAGIGISEVSDAVAIIVSEETGEIAYAKQGRVKANVSFAELERLLNKDI